MCGLQILTDSQVRRVLVEVVGRAPQDVQVTAGPGDSVVGCPSAPVPGEQKNVYFKRYIFLWIIWLSKNYTRLLGAFLHSTHDFLQNILRLYATSKIIDN